MFTKQTIAIIGATGKMGTAIAKRLAKGNYRLLLFGKRESALQELEKSIIDKYPFADIEPVTCSYTASWEADIIILAVPYAEEIGITVKIKEVANQKIVISISNPLNENFDGLVTPPGSSAAEELQKLLPHSKVVKAFNTIFSTELAINNEQKLDLPIAGNDTEAITDVIEMVQTAGLRPVFKGALSESRKLEQQQLARIIEISKQTIH